MEGPSVDASAYDLLRVPVSFNEGPDDVVRGSGFGGRSDSQTKNSLLSAAILHLNAIPTKEITLDCSILMAAPERPVRYITMRFW